MEKKDCTRLCLEVKEPLRAGNTIFISVNDFRLTKYDKEKAYRELNETEERKISCLKYLKEKLEGDTTRKYRTDDEFLLRYLRFGKFNLEEVCRKFHNFNSFRRQYSEIFTIPPDFETLINRGFLTYFPYTTEEGSILFRLSFRKWKIEEMTYQQMFQVGHLIADVISMNPKLQINGSVGIWDFRDVTMKHVMQLVANPRMTWFASKIIQNVYPQRVKLIIVLHVNSLIRKTIKALRPLIKKKVSDRIVLLGSDVTELLNYINPVLLPKEYGGTLEESEIVSSKEVLQNLPYLMYENSFV